MFITMSSQLTSDLTALSKFLDGIIGKASSFATNLLYAIVILIVGKFLIKHGIKILSRMMERAKVEVGIIRFSQSVMRIVFYAVLFIVIAGTIGIQTTSFITLLGSAGVAVGLAMQGSLSNFAGGVMILLLKPFVVGDYIIVAGADEGTVERVDIFYTHLTSVDNKSVLIPNGELSTSRITNVTAMTKRRVDVKVGISYTSDIELAKKVMREVAENYEFVLKDEEITTIVSALNDSSVEMQLRVWVAKENYWTTLFYLNETIKTSFDQAGVVIPFNQLDVHVVKDL